MEKVILGFIIRMGLAALGLYLAYCGIVWLINGGAAALWNELRIEMEERKSRRGR